MRFLFVFFTFFLTTLCYSQKDLVRYTEEEIAVQDKYVEAKKYMLIGRFEKAEEILLALYKEDRTNAAISMELSKVYGYLEDAYNEHRYAKVAAENAPENEYVLANYAAICVAQEKFVESVLPLKELVLKNQYSEEYSDKLATVYLELNDHTSAIKIYDELETKIGTNENIARRKFEIYEILGQEVKAIEELEKLTKAYPFEVRFFHNLASYYRKIGKDKEALNIYQKILTIDINDATSNMALSTAGSEETNDNTYLRSLTPIIENKTIPSDRKILELVPFVAQLNVEYNQELADALIMLADKITVIHGQEAKSYALYGDVLMAAGRSKDASKAYEKTLSIDDRVYGVWEGLMEAYSDLRDHVNLLRVSSEALDLFPNKASAYMFYGRANSFKGDFNQAIDLLEEGTLVSGKDLYSKSNIYAELGRAFLGKKDIIVAEKNVQKALEISENKNGLAHEVKGDILFHNGQKEAAIQEWKMAQQLGIKSTALTQKIEEQKL